MFDLKQLFLSEDLSKEQRAEIVQDMLNHLNEKYEEEFQSSGLRKATLEYQSMDFYPVSDSKNWSTCTREVKEDGTVEYRDNWAIHIFEPVYQAEIEPLVKAYFPESVVVVGISSFTSVPNNVVSIENKEDFRAFVNESASLDIGLYLPAASEEEINWDKMNSLKAELANYAKSGGIFIHAYTPDNYEKYVVEDVNHCKEKGQAYTLITTFNKSITWGFDTSNEEEG